MDDYEKVEQQAAQWVAREDRGIAPDEAANLAAWLDASVANRIAYLRLKTRWEQTRRLAALKASSRFSDRSASRLLLTRLALAAAAAMVLAAGGGYYFYLHRAVQAVYATRFGERSVLHLPDGTQIQLNAETRVRTSITHTTRTVTLDAGEAYFEVVHDANRPFVVLAGNRRITDLGTKFSVRRLGDDVRVTVVEGRVRIDVVNAPGTPEPVFANGGNIVVAKANETLVAPRSAQETSDDLGWRSGMLVFDQETLANAADEFNRYNHKQIVVEGAARDIRIGGSFRADNIHVFALLVRNALGLKVRDESDQIVISK